jgi:hypothetical protein
MFKNRYLSASRRRGQMFWSIFKTNARFPKVNAERHVYLVFESQPLNFCTHLQELDHGSIVLVPSLASPTDSIKKPGKGRGKR